MTKANEYTVKRINENTFELWYDDQCLATLTRKEAWPVLIGQVHPESIIRDQTYEEKSSNNQTKEQ
jgi:hypothetical protein